MSTKKKVIIVFLIVLMTLFFVRTTDKKIASGEEITMYIASDIHYFPKRLTDYSKGFKEFATPRDGKELYYIEDIMDAFVRDIGINKPDILIVSGDLTNNGELKGHEALAEQFKKIEKTGTDVFLIPGNHDILSIWTSGYRNGGPYVVDNTDHEEFKEIYKDFGYGEAISHDKKTLSYLAAPSEDLWLLMLDSNKYHSDFGMPTNTGYITDETLEWIRESGELAKKNNAEIIAITHHNLLNHSLTKTEGTIINNAELIKLFEEYDIRLNFSGHIHIQDIKNDNEENPKVYDVVNSAFSVYPQQYGVLKYSPYTGFEYSKSKVDVEGYSIENNLEDENLSNFSSYSRNSFGIRPYENAVHELENLGTYSEKEIEEIANMVMELNLRWFDGSINSYKHELFKTQVYKDFIDIKSDYLYDFVYRMVHSGDLDGSYLTLPPKN